MLISVLVEYLSLHVNSSAIVCSASISKQMSMVRQLVDALSPP